MPRAKKSAGSPTVETKLKEAARTTRKGKTSPPKPAPALNPAPVRWARS